MSSEKNNKIKLKILEIKRRNYNHDMGTVLAIFQRPFKIFIVFKCNFKSAFDIPMTLFTNKDAVIMVYNNSSLNKNTKMNSNH